MGDDLRQFGPAHGVLELREPRRWWLLASLGSLITMALVGAAVFDVTLTSHGPGKLRTEQGPRPIVSEIGGTVENVLVSSGQCLRHGEPLLQIASSAIRAELLQSNRRLEAAEERATRVETQRSALFERRVRLLEEKQRLLTLLAKNQSSSTRAAQVGANAAAQLVREGAAARNESAVRYEELRASERETIRLEQESAETSIQVDDLAAEHDDELWRARELLGEARAAREALAFALERTTLRAPQDGCVDAILVRAGDVIDDDGVVARLVPAEPPRALVAFLPERDRATVAEGDEVRIELFQMPPAEFGALRGRIDRIALEVATSADVSEGLGEQMQLVEPSYRVSISILDTNVRHDVWSRLRAGMLVEVRYRLRRRRLISFLFAPFERLFG